MYCTRVLWSASQQRMGQVAEVSIWTVTAFYADLIRKGWLYNFRQLTEGREKCCLTRWVWMKSDLETVFHSNALWNFPTSWEWRWFYWQAVPLLAPPFPSIPILFQRGLFQRELIMFGRLSVILLISVSKVQDIFTQAGKLVLPKIYNISIQLRICLAEESKAIIATRS